MGSQSYYSTETINRSPAFGFLASQEVKDAGVGNLGLQDRKKLSIVLSTSGSSSEFLNISCYTSEREALRWVQKYIGAFGGDPTKVTMFVQLLPYHQPRFHTCIQILTIFCFTPCSLPSYSWGESAGAISVALHMLTNGGDTEGLFRGAFMESGSPIPVGDITGGQPYYDDLVERTGCSGSSDTLECLRGVEYQTLLDAVNQSPSIFSYQVN